jgi:hypothetical protein
VVVAPVCNVDWWVPHSILHAENVLPVVGKPVSPVLGAKLSLSGQTTARCVEDPIDICMRLACK